MVVRSNSESGVSVVPGSEVSGDCRSKVLGSALGEPGILLGNISGASCLGVSGYFWWLCVIGEGSVCGISDPVSEALEELSFGVSGGSDCGVPVRSWLVISEGFRNVALEALS